MKFARFIAVTSLLLVSTGAFACGPIYYSPSGYYLFHLVNVPETDIEFNLNSRENCLLWQEQTSKSISLNDIYQVVYKYDLETLNRLKLGMVPAKAKDNQMAKWLRSRDGKEALDFLILAKNCEWLRRECLSPWYYPSKNDPVRFTLDDVAEQARKMAGDESLGDRYVLQAVRAMTSLKQYEEIIRFWNENESRIPEGLMRRMTLSYVAGAYVHLDDMERAKTYYKLADDLNGLVECDLRFRKGMSRVERMGLLYESYPDCPEFRVKIWEILGRIEPDRDWNDEWQWDWYRDHERKDVEELAALCDKVLNSNLPADKALWAYAATYIAHLKGDDRKADSYLKIAENTVKDQDLSDAIKVMRIYIDAQICTYDKAYEQKLFAQLRWLQQMLENNIDSQVVKGFDLYELTACFSYYYWSDAMRCILLGTVCPKLIKQGNTTLALQLANMSSYSFLNEVNRKKAVFDYRHRGVWNSYDFCNHFVEMADSLSADALIAYVDVTLKPKTEFQRFLSAHSYAAPDYLNELIGTHCLREMRYADAERYLMKVSPDYFACTNVYKDGYLSRDPFSMGRRRWNHGTDAKLYFARRMNQLEQDIAAATDPNRKAMLMIDFGIGIRNSFDYCWALTQYRRGWDGFFGENWEEMPLTKQALKRTERLFEKALNLFTDDESAAQAQWVFGNYKTICEQYPETLAAEIVRGHCDWYVDYHAER